MRELSSGSSSDVTLAIQKVVTEAGYRVHDLFYAGAKKSYMLVVDLKTINPISKEDLDKFVSNLTENVPVIDKVYIDFNMVKRTGGFPAFVLTTTGWN